MNEFSKNVPQSVENFPLSGGFWNPHAKKSMRELDWASKNNFSLFSSTRYERKLLD